MESNTHNNQQPTPPRGNNSSTTVGTIIILFGVFILLKNLELSVFFPDWLFGWEMILIIIGLVIGVNSNFKKKSAPILIIIGSVFLLKDWLNFSTGKILIPAIAIIIGIYIINRNRKGAAQVPPTPEPPPSNPTDEFDWDKRVIDFDNNNAENTSNTTFASESQTQRENSYKNHFSENYLKVESIFGNANKIVVSRNFLGGTVTNIFGSTKINLLQADLQQPIVIDIFSLFGSAKIIVPPHWYVNQNISSIISEVDDRRMIISHQFDENKKLYITGTSIFGNVTIKNV